METCIDRYRSLRADTRPAPAGNCENDGLALVGVAFMATRDL